MSKGYSILVRTFMVGSKNMWILLDGCNICFKGEANLKLYALVIEPRCYYIPSEFENVFRPFLDN